MQRDMTPTNLRRRRAEEKKRRANEQYSRRLIDIRRDGALGIETEKKQK